MIARFFRNPGKDLDHADAERRLTAIRDLQPDIRQRLQPRLAAMAGQDPDMAVRLAAIDAIDQPGLILPLLDLAPVAETAAARLVAIGHHGVDHPVVLRHRLVTTSDRDAALGIAARLPQPAVADLVCRCERGVRESLARSIRAEADLVALEKASRGRDKTVNRIARDRLEFLKTHEAAIDETRGRVAELLDALAHADDPGGEARWRALHETAARLLDRLATLRAELEPDTAPVADDAAVPDADLRARWTDLSPPEPPAAAGQPQAAPGIDALLGPIAQLLADVATGDGDVDRQDSRWRELRERWFELRDVQTPTDQQQSEFDRIDALIGARRAAVRRLADVKEPAPAANPDIDSLQRRKRVYDMLIDRVGWPPQAAPPSGLAQLDEARQSAARALADRQARVRDLSTGLKHALDELEKHLDGGRLADAEQLHRNARSLLHELADDAEASARGRLQRLSQQLTELRDWQRYATRPKREGLVRDIQRLAANPLEPEAQAGRVALLRRQWQALGQPRDSTENSLQAAFDSAAEAAFTVCREHFEAQARIRTENLQARTALCDQLDAYLENTSWQAADMKAAEHIMRTARREWRALQPVDRRANEPVQARFETLQDTLHAKVKAAWDRNLDAKTQIVEEARLLAEQAASRPDPDAMKALQTRWKAVGVTPRGPDQRLWRAFRGYCDQVFDARRAHQENIRAGQNQRVEQAQAICDEMAHALDRAADQASQAQLQDFRRQLAELGDLGPAGRAVERRFSELASHFSLAIRDRARSELVDTLNELERWDQGPLDPGAPPHPFFADRDPAGIEVFRQLTIRAELEAGIAGPDTEREERIALQVERLNASLGSPQGSPDRDALTLAERWCRLAPTSDTGMYRRRFFAALRHLAQAG